MIDTQVKLVLKQENINTFLNLLLYLINIRI